MASSHQLVWVLCALLASACARQVYPCCTCGENGVLEPPDREEPNESLQALHWKPLMDAKEFCDSQTKKVDLHGKRLEALPDCLSPFAVEVNASRNQLLALPSAAQLNPLLVVLDVSRNNISLDGEGEGEDELRALSALEVLRVGGNRLRHLRFLPSPCALRRLRAQRNALASLEGPLRGCALLEELDVADNALEDLPAGAFFGLARLRELSLSRNPLRRLAPRLFAGLTRLRLLDLAATGLRELPQGSFEGLPTLEHVILSGNELTTLPGKVFADQNLISLDLSKNEFTTIPGLIKRLTSLEKLNLGGNGIRAIPEKYFRKNKRLRELSLSKNGIPSLTADTFAGLASLEKLDLSRNPLTKLPEGVFRDAVNLEALDVSRCPLETLTLGQEEEDGGLARLARVDARGVGVRALGEESLAELPALRCLNLRDAPLAALRAGAFARMPRLRALLLGTQHGKLKQVEEDVFADLTELEKLDLQGHQLDTLPKGIFKTNRHLVDLNLENNRLRKLPEGIFAGLDELQRLLLSNNLLKTLPVLRDCCGDLSYASFENNSIAHPSEEALAVLLRPDAERVVELRGNPLRPRSFAQLARAAARGGGENEGVGEGEGRLAFTRDEEVCECGSVRRGRAELHLCVDAPCGANDAWALAARAASTPLA